MRLNPINKDSIIKLSQSCVRQAEQRLHQAETAKTRHLEMRGRRSAILHLNLASELKAMADETDQQKAFDTILARISQTEERRLFLLKYLSCGKLI